MFEPQIFLDPIAKVAICSEAMMGSYRVFYVERSKIKSVFDVITFASNEKLDFTSAVSRMLNPQDCDPRAIVDIILIDNRKFWPISKIDLDKMYFINARDLYAEGIRALRSAIEYNDLNMVKYLVDKRPDLVTNDVDLHELLNLAIRSNNVDIFSTVFVKIKSVDHSSLQCVLSLIVRAGQIDMLCYALGVHHRYADLMANSVYGYRLYPIHWAVKEGQEVMAMVLFKYTHKWVLLSNDHTEMTLLSMAVKNRMYGLVEKLIESPYAYDLIKQTTSIARRMCVLSSEYFHYSILHQAATSFPYELFKKLYELHLRYDLFVPKAPGGDTILHSMLKAGSIRSSMLFIKDFGLTCRTVYYPDNQHHTPLELANILGYDCVVQAIHDLRRPSVS